MREVPHKRPLAEDSEAHLSWPLHGGIPRRGFPANEFRTRRRPRISGCPGRRRGEDAIDAPDPIGEREKTKRRFPPRRSRNLGHENGNEFRPGIGQILVIPALLAPARGDGLAEMAGMLAVEGPRDGLAQTDFARVIHDHRHPGETLQGQPVSADQVKTGDERDQLGGQGSHGSDMSTRRRKKARDFPERSTHAVRAGSNLPHPAHARASRMTCPCTSVSRRSIPLWYQVSRSWSIPNRCRMVAWKS